MATDESTAQRVRQLRTEGMTYKAIMLTLGVSLRTVRAVLVPGTNERTPAQQERRRAAALQRKLDRNPIVGELRISNGSTAMVDPEDWERFRLHRFWLAGPGYVAVQVEGRQEYLHRLILGLEPRDGRYCDHINRDKLDNRRANLRIVTQKENCANRGGIFETAA